MKKTTLANIFIRSFFIHATLNFRRMQNIGFAMSVIPLIGEWKLRPNDRNELLTRHLQRFNTNPYFAAPVIGTVIRLEEEQRHGSGNEDAVAIKQSMMGPYAAIGDTFFWGALRPFTAIIAVVIAFMGYIIMAPVAFLLLYTPAQVWIRLKGFLEGYRQGKQGIEFIRLMNLPRAAVRIRWLSLVILSFSSLWLFSDVYQRLIIDYEISLKLVALALIMLCVLLIKKKISQFYIIYTAAIIFLFISLGASLN